MRDNDTKILEERYISTVTTKSIPIITESIGMYSELLSTAIEDDRSKSWYDKIISHMNDDIAYHQKNIDVLTKFIARAEELKSNIPDSDI